jgi:uncharacterized protein RhaS with RHS repeats
LLLGHRYYDPSVGRFLSRDPIGDGRNWYTYTENSPVSNVDYTGLWVTVADLIDYAGVALSWKEFIDKPSWKSFGWAVVDTVTAVVPVVPGTSVRHGSKILKAMGRGAKSAENWKKHVDSWKKAKSELAELENALKLAKGKKERERIMREIEKKRKDIAGHEKEMRQKWGNDWLNNPQFDR